MINEKEVIQLQGTGFFVKKFNDLFLITNRHVIEPGYNNADYKNFTIQEFWVEGFEETDASGIPHTVSDTKILNFKNFIYHANYFNDIACLKAPASANGMKIISALPYTLLATNEWLKHKLSVCDSIAYPGFPQWYDKENNTPIFRMGTIASDPRLNYACFFNEPNADRIAYEGFSTSGASGSPVFSTQRGFAIGNGLSASDDFYREVKLIGINAGHFKDQIGHSGISYFYKSSAILDIIDSI